jgi:hypothetical protein
VGLIRSWITGSDVGPDDRLVCGACGLSLDDDPDDDLEGGPGWTPLCGPCARNRDEEADLAMLDLRDGELDGFIDW